METSRDRVLEAALTVLGTKGASGFSIRGAEAEAGVPHGTVRHHFGGLDGLVEAMVEHLLAADLASIPSPREVATHGLRVDGVRTTARYELMLMSLRHPALNRRFLDARDRLVAHAVAAGVPAARARTLVVAADGLVLDALLRGESTVAVAGLVLEPPRPTRPPAGDDTP